MRRESLEEEVVTHVRRTPPRYDAKHNVTGVLELQAVAHERCSNQAALDQALKGGSTGCG